MLITKDYKIEKDKMQFILSERSTITGEKTRGSKPKPENIGKDVWNVIGYYSLTKTGFNTALGRIMLNSIPDDVFMDASIAIKKLDELFTLLNGLQYR